MSDASPYEGIFVKLLEQHRSPMGPPEQFIASRKLLQVIRDAREEHPSEEAFADWLANYMEGYAAAHAHPVFDVSDGAGGDGPECSLCGMLWPMCGHHHMSHWQPVNRTTNSPTEEN